MQMWHEAKAAGPHGRVLLAADRLTITGGLAALLSDHADRIMDAVVHDLDEAIAADNAILDAAHAGGAVTGVHLCRGNGMGAWLSSCGYDPIADKVFSLHADRLLLEYDTERAGTFDALRAVPSDKLVVLGLVSTKTPALESSADLRRRIEEASAFVPMERLALSPQCGFASDFHGNPISEDDQWRKLELVASVANEVWGGVSAGV